jgi:high affinity sulfate transporter 1
MNIPQFVGWRGFDRRQVKSDLVAALVVTAIAIPESLGFAAIVGLPVQTGLYCALLAPVVFALLTSSKHLVVGADSATAALVAAGAGTVAVAGTAAYSNAIALLGVLTGVVLIVMALARFGFLADLISKPVFVGFLAGIGVQLVLGKFPELVGVEAHGAALAKFGHVLTHLGAVHLPTLFFSLSLFAVLWLCNRRKLPGSLVVLIVAIVATYVGKLHESGVAVIGTVPSGLPSLVIPHVTLSAMGALLPSAIAIAVVILAQSSAVIRSTAARFDEPVDDNRDLTALGFGNIASALTHGFAINGSPPRSLAAEMSGGRTQLVNVFMALCIALVLLGATPLMRYVPMAALAVIVCSIGLHLLDLKQLRRIYRTRPAEWLVALIALVGVVLFGVQYGVAIAVVCSIVDRLRRQYRPEDAILLRDGKLADWAEDRIDKHHRYRSSPPGVLVYWFGGSIFFENSAYFYTRIIDAINGAKKPVHLVLIDAGSVNDIDFTAAETLKRLAHKLNSDDIQLGLAHVPPKLTALLQRYDLDDIIGKQNIYTTLTEAVFDAPLSHRSSVEMVHRLDPPNGSYVVIGGGVLEALHLRETNDVDLVVTKNLYDLYHQKGWKEYVQDDGKRILSHNGYQLMQTYVGRSLKDLKPHAFTIDGVHFMGIEDLIACKHTMGRRKDHADIVLLETYLKKHSKQL